MSGDDLERAVAALREQGDNPAPQARLTKDRILRELRPRARRRRAVWLIPLAALLAGSTVLAATGRLPEAYHAAARALGLEARTPAAAPVTAPSRAAHREPAAKEPEAPMPPTTTTAASEPEAPPQNAGAPPTDQALAPSTAAPKVRRHEAKPDAKEAQVRPATTETVEPAPTPSSSEAASAEEDPTLALYRRARHLHFVEQNPEAALAAWNAYLAADPRGPLAVDARYERALCLVRLGRKSEARPLLEPFAAGKYGSYRQNEARALLDALK
jgi:hypothetical protein